jgi:putative transposase
MAVREKIFLPNELYFITFTILGWKKIFTEDKYANLVYKWFDYMKEKYENKIFAYVIMPNHIHLIILLGAKSPKLSTLMQNAKRFMAYGIVDLLKEDNETKLLNYFKNHADIKKGAKHKVFEDRYDSKIIQTKKFFLEKIKYIHNNPCSEKWMLAPSPELYKYSSASNYFLGKGFCEVEIMEM